MNRSQAHVRPDGFARLESPGGAVELLLELDLGSEIRSRLEEKMERYRALARAATAPDVVVFCFPSEAREVSARQVLFGTPMPVATATLDSQHEVVGIIGVQVQLVVSDVMRPSSHRILVEHCLPAGNSSTRFSIRVRFTPAVADRS